MPETSVKLSISLPRELAETARERSGEQGLSAYVAAALVRQIERDNLNDLIVEAERVHGPVSESAVDAHRQRMREARAREHEEERLAQ